MGNETFYADGLSGVTVRNRDFPRHQQFKYKSAFKNKEKRRALEYISVSLVERNRYEVLRCLGCIWSDT